MNVPKSPEFQPVKHFGTCKQLENGWCWWTGRRIKHVPVQDVGMYVMCTTAKTQSREFEGHCRGEGCTARRNTMPGMATDYFYLLEDLKKKTRKKMGTRQVAAVEVEEDDGSGMSRTQKRRMRRKRLLNKFRREWREDHGDVTRC